MELDLILFTLGYIFQHFASVILILEIRKKKTIEGLSHETQLLLLVGAAAKCIWVFDTRLLNFYLQWVELISGIILLIYIQVLFRKLKDTRYHDIKNFFDWRVMILIGLVLCFCFHPGDKGKYYLTVQMLVSFNMFIEAIAMVPQIYLMRKLKQIEVSTANYILLLGLSRLIRLAFWVCQYYQGTHFIHLIVADFLHCAFLADFVYCYFKSNRNGVIIID